MDAGIEGGSFAINVDDARFSSIFTGVLWMHAVLVLQSLTFFCSDPNYAVDPLNPLFQRTPGMQQVLKASQSKRLKQPKAPGNSSAAAPSASAAAGGMSAELKLLVSSVKSKAPRT